MSFNRETFWDVTNANSELGPWDASLTQVAEFPRRNSSNFLQRVLTRRRSSTQSAFDVHGRLGLNILSSPCDPLLDIIFVHGLGGGSTKTWCFSEDASLFWPKAWLPKESGFQNARIHSYGYDADWMSAKATPTINIQDFGQQLLEKIRNSPELAEPRTCPIIFIAHSMGGLVVKQAYVLARQDPSCDELAKRIKAMLFLSTPHRGSNLAQTLNNVLRASATHSTRPYISNLSQQNELLLSLNDSFRHYASDVSLYSFYESRATDLYVRSEIIVTKNSAIMGYHHERYAMLNADHRSICKFESPSDPNYITIVQTLQNMTEGFIERSSSENAEETWQAMQQIESYLAMPARPDDDLKDLEEARIEGSCEWFAERETFQRWAIPHTEDRSMVYWISANPATGKSVLSSYVIDALTNLNIHCSYYFFRHGDKDRSTLSGLLRSLLYQMALRSTHVRRQLLLMADSAVRFKKDDSKAIWRKLVWPILSHTSATITHYWVLDALDECSDFEALFPMMKFLDQNNHLRIFFTSRKLPGIAQKFFDLQNSQSHISVHIEEISLEDTKADIRLYLEANRHKFHVGDEGQRNSFIFRILDKSEGCFLWVRLVLDELALAWSINEARRVLDEVPQEMDLLYSRALKIISSKPKKTRDLTCAILTWIVCAARPLTVTELREALKLDLNEEVPELEMAIASLCAQLVHVDKTERAMIVHLTAKTFLINHQLYPELQVNPKVAHLRLAKSCLEFLCSDQMKVPQGRRAKQKQFGPESRSPFARYACLEFAEHLRHTTSGELAVSSKLYNFLQDNVFSWIEFVAATGNLSILARTANSINAYVQRHIRSSSPLGEFVHLTQNWAIDLHRIVTGFGPTLLAYPSAIYWLIPPFCPESSAIFSTAASRFKRITVRGLKGEGWNDRMSCIDSHDSFVSAVACADTIFAIGCNSGRIIFHHDNTCLPWKTLEHGSPTRHLLFNSTSTHLLSSGRRDVKMWDVESGFVQWASQVSHDIMNVAITEDGKVAMAADKNNIFTSWNMQSGIIERKLCWSENLPFSDEVGFRRPPLTAAFSPDPSLIAIVYRGRPICLYDLDENANYGLVSREGDPDAQGLGSMTSPSSLVFNTKKDNYKLAAAYEDGDLCLFDYEDLKLLKTIEGANAHIVACSPDGLTLATGNSAGMVQLLEFDTLQLFYRVNAADYGIRDLAFSVDNLRFVDVRGTQCNVWEPAALGLAKHDDSSTEPAELDPIIKAIENEDSDVTSVEVEDSGLFFFVGRSDGSLSLYDTISSEQLKVLYRHNCDISITSILWGSQKHIIATSDTARRFIVCSLQRDVEVGWKVATKLLDRRADSMVLQLLLDSSNDLLLVSTERSNNVWNLRTRQLVSTQTWQPSPSFTWINHPVSSVHCMLVTAAAVTMFEWVSLCQFRSTSILQSQKRQTPNRAQCVKNTFPFAQGRFLVAEFSQLYEETSTVETFIFNLNPFDSETEFLVLSTEFNQVGEHVRHVIGAWGSRLLFLDLNYWVSSIDANQSNPSHYVQHFHIPSDWQSQQRRLQLDVTQNGDVLFVRKNEVAVISHGLAFEKRVQLKP